MKQEKSERSESLTNLAAQLRALLAASTPRPWIRNGTGGYVAFFSLYNGKIGEYISSPYSELNSFGPDAQLIVSLRNNAETLLDRLEELEENRAISDIIFNGQERTISDLRDRLDKLEAVVAAASNWEDWIDCETNPPLIKALAALSASEKLDEVKG